jgi:tetratricopeptide (TPR) repeat protein
MKHCGLKGFLCLAISFILISSCGGGRKTTVTRETDQARRDLASGQYQKALDQSHADYQAASGKDDTLQQYLEVIEHIRASAETSFGREDFAAATETYALLLKNYPRFAPIAQRLSFTREYLVLRIRLSRILLAERQSLSYLKAGNPQKAIQVCQEVHHQYPRDLAVRNHCSAVLESIKANADLAFKNEDLAQAGLLYGALERHFETPLFKSCSLSYDQDHLKTSLAKCRRKLFEAALEQYRTGNLSQAVAIWKSILTFDPENQEARKAAETAALQLKNIQKDSGSHTK